MSDAPVVDFDIDMFPNNTILSGNGWTCYDQSFGYTANVTASTGIFDRTAAQGMAINYGNWASVSYDKFLNYGDYDISFKAYAQPATTVMFVYVRCSANNAFFPNCYALGFGTGSAVTTAGIYKFCGGSNYSVFSNASMPAFNTNGCLVRIQMLGLVLTAWINGNLVGSYDFTGNALCSSVVFSTGTFGFISYPAGAALSPASLRPLARTI